MINIKFNILANFLGRVYSGVISLIFVPFYIKFLGIEAYGLIGIFTTLIGLFAVMDLGLSTTLTRAMAQYSINKPNTGQLQNLVKSFEIVYWFIGSTIALSVFLAAPWLAEHWINPHNISKETVIDALRLMGAIIIFQWPTTLYASGLMGLQRQVLINVIRSCMATAQVSGAILILWLISPSIEAFFIWQLLIHILQAWLMTIYLSKSLPSAPNHHAQFEKKWLLHNWKFSAGTMGITILATFLTQIDKIIISKWLSLTIFGYYTLAFAVSNSIQMFSSPIFSAVFPRFSQLFSEKNEKDLANLYQKSSQFVSLLIFPIGINIAFFSADILLLWVKDTETVQITSPLLSVLILGTIANSVMLMPFALQLASGWTKLSFYKNLVAVILFLPMLIFLINKYGAMGAAISWLVLNIGYIFIEPLIMHSRLLQSEVVRWYLFSIIIPLILVLGITTFYINIVFDHSSWLFALIASLLTEWLLLTLILFKQEYAKILLRFALSYCGR